MLDIPLTEAEEKWRERLQRMFPPREGGADGLEKRLLERKRALDAVKLGVDVPKAVVDEWEERLRGMFPQREGGVAGLTKRLRARYAAEEAELRAKRAGNWNRVDDKARPTIGKPMEARQIQMPLEPEWNDAPVDERAEPDEIWGEQTRFALEFPNDAPVIAVTPLEFAKEGLCAFQYVGDAENPDGVVVRYTREQLALANCLVKVLTAEDDAAAEAIWNEFEHGRGDGNGSGQAV